MRESEPTQARKTWQARSSWNGDAISGNASNAMPNTTKLARGDLDTVKLLARAEQPPRPHDQSGNEHQKGNHVGEQRIDVVNGEDLGGGDDDCAHERA